jgi:hypothetical protein
MSNAKRKLIGCNEAWEQEEQRYILGKLCEMDKTMAVSQCMFNYIKQI